MLKKISWISFYLCTSLLILLLGCYFFKWVEIIFLLNYLLYLFALITLSLTWAISFSISARMRLISLSLNSIGSIIWILALWGKLDFEKYWNLAFIMIITGLLIAFYMKSVKNTSKGLKVITGLSLVTVLIGIYLTGISYFENIAPLIIILGIHSITSAISYFSKNK